MSNGIHSRCSASCRECTHCACTSRLLQTLDPAVQEKVQVYSLIYQRVVQALPGSVARGGDDCQGRGRYNPELHIYSVRFCTFLACPKYWCCYVSNLSCVRAQARKLRSSSSIMDIYTYVLRTVCTYDLRKQPASHSAWCQVTSCQFSRCLRIIGSRRYHLDALS